MNRPQTSRARRWFLRLIPLVLLPAAAAVLWREFQHTSLAEVLAAMGSWSDGAILIALALSATSFMLMGVIECLGLRWTGARLPLGRAMGGSFMANAVAHSVGANLLVSGALRTRLYSPYGVTLAQVAGTTLFSGMTFAVGLSTLSGASLLLTSLSDFHVIAIPRMLARTLGGVLLSAVLVYLLVCAIRRTPISAFGRQLTLPSWRIAATQVVVGVTDNGIAAAILWTLLPGGSIGYLSFVSAYAIACVTGLASSVPGGVGVFESALATLLPRSSPAALAAAFLGFRLAFYILPLAIASLALAGDTVRRRRTINARPAGSDPVPPG